jgi:hypothetical protein
MKRYSLNCRAALVGVLAAGSVIVAGAQNWVRYEAQPGGKVKISGTSTMHDWTVEGAIIGGAIELAEGVGIDTAQKAPGGLKEGKLPARVQATIPVRSLKSGKSAMDSVMMQAMKQTEHPRIEYRLMELTPKAGEHAPGTPFVFDAKGTLTISGVTKTNTMEVKMDRVAPDKLKTTGSAALKMTDFGIKPPAPKMALGLITTGDDVKVEFEWLTAMPAPVK